ncbi:MAG: hypothetical protein R6W06_02920, partial [Prochlorococcaceae cyanobacterium]
MAGLLALQEPAALAQGKSQQAPGRQRGNPNPGQGKGQGKGPVKGQGAWPGQSKGEREWESWDRERWRDYNRNSSYNHWATPVRTNPYAYRPAWATPNWAGARPWPTGWYGGWRQPPWLWWPGQSAAWGVGSLAAAPAINGALEQALGFNQPTFLVPSTPWRLVYGSVQPVGYGDVNFVISNGASYYRMIASCDGGLLNGLSCRAGSTACSRRWSWPTARRPT